MWRGFRDLGAALTSIAARNASAPPSLRALGANLTAEAPPILRDLQVNISPCSPNTSLFAASSSDVLTASFQAAIDGAERGGRELPTLPAVRRWGRHLRRAHLLRLHLPLK